MATYRTGTSSIKRCLSIAITIAGVLFILNPLDVMASSACIRKTRKLNTVIRKIDRTTASIDRINTQRDRIMFRFDLKAERFVQLRTRHVENQAIQAVYCAEYTAAPDAPENRQKVHSCHKAFVLLSVIAKVDVRIASLDEARARSVGRIDQKVAIVGTKILTLQTRAATLTAEVAEACTA